MRVNFEEIWFWDVLEEDLQRYEEKILYLENLFLIFGFIKRGKFVYFLSGLSYRFIMGQIGVGKMIFV